MNCPTSITANRNGESVRHVPMPDRITTDIGFGGEDLRTAYVTWSTTGKLAAVDWEAADCAIAQAESAEKASERKERYFIAKAGPDSG